MAELAEETLEEFELDEEDEESGEDCVFCGHDICLYGIED